MEDVYDIAIIGAGPAGIATSVEAVVFGVKKVVVFEKGENHSQTIRKYFDDKKPVDKDWKGIKVALKGHIDFEEGTKNDTLNLFEDALEKNLIHANFNTEVTHVEKKDECLFEIFTNSTKSYFAKNLVIAIGKMGKPNKPDYPIPPSLKKSISYTIKECCGNQDVLVVGGGDSACEYAFFIHHDNRVTLSYRKDSITRANPKNIQNLMDKVKENKIKLKLGIDIVKVEDEEGRAKVTFADDSIETFDRIIYAIGGTTPKAFLEKMPLVLDEKGNPQVDENNYNSDGVYLAGDIAGSIGGSIALALNHGYNIIQAINQSRT